MYVYVCIYIYIYIFMSIHLYIYPSINQSINLPIYFASTDASVARCEQDDA